MPTIPVPAAPEPATPEQRAQTTCLLILSGLAVGYTLYLLRDVVVPFVVSVVLVYSLTPIVRWFERRGCRPGVAVIGAFAVSFIAVLAFAGLVTACVRELSLYAGDYLNLLNERAREPEYARLLDWFGIKTDDNTSRLKIIEEDAVRDLVRRSLGWFEGMVSQTLLVLVFVMFILFGRSAGGHSRTSPMLDEIETRVRRYLLEMTGFSVLTGVLVGSILSTLGVDFALVFGFLAFALRFIPTLGPIAATVLPVPVIVLDPTLPVWMKILAVVLPGTVQVVVGNIIQPQFQSKTQGLHPAATMLALMIFGLVWGTVGAVLAVPLAGALKIALEQIPGGRPFADILAGNLGSALTQADPAASVEVASRE